MKRDRERVGEDGRSSVTRSGTGKTIEWWTAIRSAHAPGASVMTPTWTPGPRPPRVKLQQSGRSPATHRGHGGSMPRGPHVSHGLTTTRCPTSTPAAPGPTLDDLGDDLVAGDVRE